MMNYNEVTFKQITACQSSIGATVFALDSMGRVWRWSSEWILCDQFDEKSVGRLKLPPR